LARLQDGQRPDSLPAAQAALSAARAAGQALVQRDAPRRYHANDPVVLLAGIDPSPRHGHDGVLFGRRSAQLLYAAKPGASATPLRGMENPSLPSAARPLGDEMAVRIMLLLRTGSPNMEHDPNPPSQIAPYRAQLAAADGGTIRAAERWEGQPWAPLYL